MTKLLVGFLYCFLFSFSVCYGAAPKKLDSLLVEAESSWLTLLVTPLTQKYRQNERFPLLSPVYGEKEDTTPIQEILFEGINIFIGTKPLKLKEPNLEHLLIVPNEPLAASLSIKKTFFPTTELAVLGGTSIPNLSLWGSLLASQLKVPFLLSNKKELTNEDVTKIVSSGVRKIYLLGPHFSKIDWKSKGIQSIVLDEQKIVHEYFQLVGKNKVRNIVLFPKIEKLKDQPALMAPFMALVRDGFPFSVEKKKSEKVEDEVYEFLNKEKVFPKSLTILAGEQVIPSRKYKIYGKSNDVYDLPIELFSLPKEKESLSLAVGRFPTKNTMSTGILFSRGLYKEAHLRSEGFSSLMFANPISDHSGEADLYLAELVGKLSVENIRNFGLTTKAYYKTKYDHKFAVKAAETAQLIFFQGHIGDHEALFYDNHFPEELPFDDYKISLMHARRPPVNQRPIIKPVDYIQKLVKFSLKTPKETDPDSLLEGTIPYRPRRLLKGAPIVFLQSCNSMDVFEIQQVMHKGAIGFFGSVTKIHSASGSSFLHAIITGALYHNWTIGEALREARNYFFLLQDLKDKRGHKEQAKSMRVALSFRYWGDPDIPIFPKNIRPLKSPPLFTWRSGKIMSKKKPAQYLKKLGNESYYAKFFPGAQSAGLVKRLKNKKRRKLAPLYYSTLALTDTSIQSGIKYKNKMRESQLVMRKSQLGNAVSVLYFPNNKDQWDEVEFK